MTEIKLEKRFPHIPDEDVTRIFQDGYRKGWENARKKAIPIEWINKWSEKFYKVINGTRYYMGDGYDTVWDMLEDWEKENDLQETKRNE